MNRNRDVLSEDIFNIIRDAFRETANVNTNFENVRNNNINNQDTNYNFLVNIMSEYNANILEYNINIREYMIRNNSNNNHSYTEYNNNISEYNDNIRRFLDIIANNRYNNDNRHRNYDNRRFNFRYSTGNANRNRQETSNIPSFSRGLYTHTPTQLLSYFWPNRTFTNVIVRPTQQQIENATQIIIFDENESYNNVSCPITMEDFNNGDQICQIKHCGHNFLQEPLRNWFRTNVRCPVCRYDIRDYEAPTEAPIEVPNNENIDEISNENEPNSQNSSETSEINVEENQQNTTQRTNPRSPLQTSRTNLSSVIQNYLEQHITPIMDELSSSLTEYDIVFPVIYYNDSTGQYDMSGIHTPSPRNR